MEVIDRLDRSSDGVICFTECDADENALGTTENDPVEGELWVF